MVRLDYCILDHILPTGKPTNLTPVRLTHFGQDWPKIAKSQDSFEFSNYLVSILHYFFPALTDYTALVKM